MSQSVLWQNGLPIPTGISPITRTNSTSSSPPRSESVDEELGNSSGTKKRPKDAEGRVGTPVPGENVRILIAKLLTALSQANVPDPVTYVQEVARSLTSRNGSSDKSSSNSNSLGRVRSHKVVPCTASSNDEAERSFSQQELLTEPSQLANHSEATCPESNNNKSVYLVSSQSKSSNKTSNQPKQSVNNRRPQSAKARIVQHESSYLGRVEITTSTRPSRKPSDAPHQIPSKPRTRKHLSTYLEERSRYYHEKYGDSRRNENRVDNQLDDENLENTDRKEYVPAPKQQRPTLLGRPTSARMLKAYQKDVERKRKGNQKHQTTDSTSRRNSTAYLHREPQIPVREKASIGRHVRRQEMHRKYSLGIQHSPLPPPLAKCENLLNSSRKVNVKKGSNRKVEQHKSNTTTLSQATKVLEDFTNHMDSQMLEEPNHTTTMDSSKSDPANEFAELEDFNQQCDEVEAGSIKHLNIQRVDSQNSLSSVSSVEGEFILDV